MISKGKIKVNNNCFASNLTLNKAFILTCFTSCKQVFSDGSCQDKYRFWIQNWLKPWMKEGGFQQTETFVKWLWRTNACIWTDNCLLFWNISLCEMFMVIRGQKKQESNSNQGRWALQETDFTALICIELDRVCEPGLQLSF